MEIWAKAGTRYHPSEVRGQGSKNAALPLIVSAIFFPRQTVLKNVPTELEDVKAILRCLDWLGVSVKMADDTLTIDASKLRRCDLPPRLSGASRYSLLFLGGLIGRYGVAKVGPPGGCQFGNSRGFDFHRAVLEKFGSEIHQEGDYLVGRLKRQEANEVTLPFPSVGATLQAMLFLTSSNRRGIIHNAAIEPEIIDVATALNRAGCDIKLIDTRSFSVDGYPSVDMTHSVPADRIHIATVMAYSAIANTPSVVTWRSPINICCLSDTFSALGVSAASYSDGLHISVDATSPTGKLDVVADVYPSFPTDAIPLVVAAIIKSGRQVRFYDKVFRGRNSYLQEFVKLGAKVTVVSDREFVVQGVPSLTSSQVSANDIRGSTSLLLGAIQTTSLSRITNAHQIIRGYEHLPLELQNKGFTVHVKYDAFNTAKQKPHLWA